jgi:endogenous inhibitor of DNA gyrase (YacG/DUF329 family)
MRCFVCDVETVRYDDKTSRPYCDDCYYAINDDIQEWFDGQQLELEFDLETKRTGFRTYTVDEQAEERRLRGQSRARLKGFRRKDNITLPDTSEVED